MSEPSVRVDVDGIVMPVLGRAQLIANKRASGRPKDLLDVQLLENAADYRGPTGSR